MEQNQLATDQGAEAASADLRARLMDTARAMVLRGEQKFSIAALCAEADVPRASFRAHFTGKTQLMAALMAEASTPAPAAQQTPKAESEPSVSTPDAWLERRLRVFERALTQLEAKAEATQKEQARIIAELEERLKDRLAQAGAAPERRLDARPLTLPVAEAHIAAPHGPAPDLSFQAGEELEQEAAAQPESQPEPERKPAAVLEISTPVPATVSREVMAEVLQQARQAARAAAAAEPEQMRAPASRTRWLAIGALSLLVLFLCIGISLGQGALGKGGANAATEADAVMIAHRPQGALARLVARADAGDAPAQARLALIYLKGEGSPIDPDAGLRFARAAAEAGQPVAQYLMGTFYREGHAVAADPAKAFHWFESAAIKGNLKAMHNLAIAYAEGLGTDKDEARAAEWFTRAAERGYVDSAFDLAVLYERGAGVPQDLKTALKWYEIAARMGDAQAEARVDVLRGQISHEAAQLAADAAKGFSLVPPLTEANRL